MLSDSAPPPPSSHTDKVWRTPDSDVRTKTKSSSSIGKNKGEGERGGVTTTTSCLGAGGHLPVYGCRAERRWTEREKRGVEGGLWWWVWLLEVGAGQLAAGRLRQLRHHAGQGPVLGLQPLLDLPQGLNLLYLGEVLQGGARSRTWETEIKQKKGKHGGGERELIKEKEEGNRREGAEKEEEEGETEEEDC